MRYLPNGKQMSEADAHTIHKIGIPSLVLMERAALQIVETMQKKNISTEKSLIVCGSGNNGGDGFAVARLLTEHVDVRNRLSKIWGFLYSQNSRMKNIL